MHFVKLKLEREAEFLAHAIEFKYERGQHIAFLDQIISDQQNLVDLATQLTELHEEFKSYKSDNTTLDDTDIKKLVRLEQYKDYKKKLGYEEQELKKEDLEKKRNFLEKGLENRKKFKDLMINLMEEIDKKVTTPIEQELLQEK